VGEWITISINEEKAVEINLLIFGVPLLLLFLMMIIMVSFFPLVTDWQLSQIVLINVVLGFILAKLLIKRRANQFKYWYLEEEEEKS